MTQAEERADGLAAAARDSYLDADAAGEVRGRSDEGSSGEESGVQRVEKLGRNFESLEVTGEREGGAESEVGVGEEGRKKVAEQVSEEEVKRLEEAAEESGGVYDEIEIEDLEWQESDQTFYYPCPCGDRFQISLDELLDGEDIAHCPSCSLRLRIVYDEESLEAVADKYGIE